ncbi:hypothetical protein [Wolbachia endosymbiont (group A) of Clivina fossor]|uniref:hypothetical protein n=1 Tax=Wolbachia endosymbiont (group A) of Clivina fossor TaxID=3066133 RepID=UPI00313306D0
MPDYDRSIPKVDEYVIIIDELCKVKAVQDFSLNTEEACVTSAVDNGSTLKSDNDPKNAQPENLVTNGESILTLEQENDAQDNSKRPGSSSKDDVTKNDNVVASVSSNNNHSNSSKIQLDESRAGSNQVSDQSTGHIMQMDDEQAPLNEDSSKLESNQQNLQSEVLHASESVDKNSSKKDSKRVSNAQSNSKHPSYSGKNNPAPQNARSKRPFIAVSTLTTVEPISVDREANPDSPSSAEPYFDSRSDNAVDKKSSKKAIQPIVAGVVGAALLVSSIVAYILKMYAIAVIGGIIGLACVSYALYNALKPGTKLEKVEDVERLDEKPLPSL